MSLVMGSPPWHRARLSRSEGADRYAPAVRCPTSRLVSPSGMASCRPPARQTSGLLTGGRLDSAAERRTAAARPTGSDRFLVVTTRWSRVPSVVGAGDSGALVPLAFTSRRWRDPGALLEG